MRRQVSGLTNRNRIRHKLRIRLLNESKSNSYKESVVALSNTGFLKMNITTTD